MQNLGNMKKKMTCTCKETSMGLSATKKFKL